MYQARIKNVLANMEKMGIRQMLICDFESIYYLTGYYNQPMERLFALYLSADGSHKFFLNKLFPMPDSDIEKIWFTDTDDYVKKAEDLSPENIIWAVSSQYSENIWMFIFLDDEDRITLVFFEADDRSIRFLMRANPRATVRINR